MKKKFNQCSSGVYFEENWNNGVNNLLSRDKLINIIKGEADKNPSRIISTCLIQRSLIYPEKNNRHPKST